MDLSELKKIIRLFEDSKIHELEIEKEGNRVKLKKGGDMPHVMAHHIPVHAPVPTHHHPAPEQPKGAAEKGGAEASSSNHVLTSPMVGTFYRAPSPTSPVFVNEGDIVQKGQVICIVEAMKLMNEIESDAAGRVVKIFPENGKPVEFEEPLFEIAPL